MARIAGYDSHNHPLYFGMFSKALNLAGLGKKEALSQIKEAKYNLVINWDNSKWELTAKEIEAEFPVVVFNRSFHGMVANRVAQQKYGLKADTSGLITEDQMDSFLDQLISGFSVRDWKEILLIAQAQYQERGLYGVDDMGLRSASLAPLQAVMELRNEGNLPLKLNLFFRYSLLKKVVHEAPNMLGLCAGLKIILDGAFGVRTAALSEPFSDDPQNYGKLLMGSDKLERRIRQAVKWGVSKIAVHCIGDRAITRVLRVYQKLANSGVNTSGWRLEHALLISRSQAELAKKLGVVLCMQPNFSEDTLIYRDRLGDRVLLLNPFRMLIDEVGFKPGKDLILGSDGMPTGLAEGLKWATEPSLKSQRLTIDEAVRAYQVKPVYQVEPVE